MAWHKHGLRVHKFVYRGWYVGQSLLSVFIIISALTPAVLLAMNASASQLELILNAIAALFGSLIGALLLWLAIHRLRKPVKPPP